MVDIDEYPDSNVHFGRVLAKEKSMGMLLLQKQTQYNDVANGDIIQISPDTWDITCDISNRIQENGGAAMIVDYGLEDIRTDRLRGIKDHAFVNPLSQPGQVDLSTDVEFNAVKRAAEVSGIAY